MSAREFNSGARVPPGEYQSIGHARAEDACPAPPRQLSAPLNPVTLPACRCGRPLRWAPAPGNKH